MLISFIKIQLYFLFQIHLVYGQDLIVVFVKGEIVFTSQNKVLDKGTKIKLNDKVVFKNSKVCCALLDKNNQLYFLKIKDSLDYSKKSVLVSENLYKPLPFLSWAGVPSDWIRDFSLYLNDYNRTNKFFILGNEEKILVDKNRFATTDSSFFVVGFESEGKRINRKLPFSGDTLFLRKEDVFKEKENILEFKEPLRTLFFYDAKNKNAIKLCDFVPVFVSREQFKEDTDFFLQILKENNTDTRQMIRLLWSFCDEFYGYKNINYESQSRIFEEYLKDN